MSKHFSEDLLQWYDANKRDLPWRDTKDPYKIWVSEIMLQQTRVDTVISYFHRFIDAFPTVHDLAEADQQQVLKLWEGLGYYSRGRNLHQAAIRVHEEFNGTIPDSYDEITRLKGIGPYTAAAILSFAYQKKHAVVDGNVIRVLSRYYGIKSDIRSSKTRNTIQKYADSLISEEHPGNFNQAIMELGAMVCKPVAPLCNECPVSSDCVAYQTAETNTIPYKSKKKKIPHHQIAVGIIVNESGKLLIALRPNDAMLGGLWEFPGGKQEQGETLEETVRRELKEELGVSVKVFERFFTLNHTYSHFKITMHAFWCKILSGSPKPNESKRLEWVSIDKVDEYPFPKANKTILNELKSIDQSDFRTYLGI